jgi:hypothetical protein
MMNELKIDRSLYFLTLAILCLFACTVGVVIGVNLILAVTR